MTSFEQKVYQYITDKQMIKAGDRVAVGVSGGPDSVCLLIILQKLRRVIGFDLAVVHVNHNLRGSEAREDANFVRALCEKLNAKELRSETSIEPIICRVYSCEVEKRSMAEKISIEEAGRKARQESFAKFAKSWDASSIALAHNQNDVAETMLYNLSRGTGLNGLASLRPRRGVLIRPLLCATRDEIEYYLETEGIPFCMDRTNLEDHYTRNKIRHHVLTYLTDEVNLQTVQHMADTSAQLAEIRDYLYQETKELYNHCATSYDRQDQKRNELGMKLPPRIELSDTLFDAPPVLVKSALRYAIRRLCGSLRDVTQKHIMDLCALAESQTGKTISLPSDIRAIRTYSGLALEYMATQEPDGDDVATDTQDLQDGIPLEIGGVTTASDVLFETHLLTGGLYPIPQKKCTKWLDYGKINKHLVIRTRRTGDYLTVTADGGTKKLSDWMINEKIPEQERDAILLLACDQEVYWVVGYRLSESCKVAPDTKQILKIEVKGGNLYE